MPVRLVAFDLDGTLLDSEPTWLQAEKALLDRRGKTMDVAEQMKQNLIGLSLPDFCERWRRIYGIEEPVSDLVAELTSEYKAAILKTAQLREGAEDALRVAHESGIPMCICTSSEKSVLEAIVGAIPLLGELFGPQSLFSGAECPRPKPAPDVYLAAANHFGVSPQEAVAFEDSPNGAASAISAGMHCFLVPENDHTKLAMQNLSGDLCPSGMKEAAEKLHTLLNE